jgi:hypothetical protein
MSSPRIARQAMAVKVIVRWLLSRAWQLGWPAGSNGRPWQSFKDFIYIHVYI